ncbi:MAG: T9SS type A sorting domain-containing protein [Bacteroidales bacterium]|nr:T9SS type A sorting domain-containing protein [Bacteroidales bacterium]
MKKALSLVCLLGLALSVWAQNNITTDQVRYWVGTGTDSALVIVNIATEDTATGDYYKTALVYGVRWNGTAITRDLMDTLSKNDYRLVFFYNETGTFFTAVNFTDTAAGIELVDSDMESWMYTDNGDTVAAITEHTVLNDHTLFFADMGYFHEIDTVIYVEAPAPTPTEFVVSAYDVPYWIGTGSNSAVIAINWVDTALAWGYRFSSNATVQDALNAIAAADSRLIIVPDGYLIGDIKFVRAAGDTIKGTSWWGSTNNGLMDAGLYQVLSDGDFEKWADGSTGIYTGSAWTPAYGGYQDYFYVYPDVIQPVDLPASMVPAEATIAADDILYWVGTGSKKAVIAINWADTALAWGFKFDGTATVQDALDSMAAADNRFSVVYGSYGVDDIVFVPTTGDTLRHIPYSYWESTNNGHTDAGLYQSLSDGDFEKWADPAAGVFIKSTYYADWNYWGHTYAYPMAIHPVSVPTSTGIDAVEAANMTVWPNPATTEVRVNFGAMSANTDAVLYDMAGREVSRRAVAAGCTSVDMTVSTLPAGVYMLRIGSTVAKVAVSR